MKEEWEPRACRSYFHSTGEWWPRDAGDAWKRRRRRERESDVTPVESGRVDSPLSCAIPSSVLYNRVAGIQHYTATSGDQVENELRSSSFFSLTYSVGCTAILEKQKLDDLSRHWSGTWSDKKKKTFLSLETLRIFLSFNWTCIRDDGRIAGSFTSGCCSITNLFGRHYSGLSSNDHTCSSTNYLDINYVERRWLFAHSGLMALPRYRECHQTVSRLIKYVI